MAHCVALIEALKRELKSRSITYAMLARALKLSEASVKRLFSRRDLSLKRLDDICRYAQIDFADLARTLVREETLLAHLTLQQEKEIVSDRKLFLVAVCTLNHVSFDEIVETYDISPAECVGLLTRLDRLKFIELLPGNRMKLLVSRTFAWLPDGPIQRFFNNQAHESVNHMSPRVFLVTPSDTSPLYYPLYDRIGPHYRSWRGRPRAVARAELWHGRRLGGAY